MNDAPSALGSTSNSRPVATRPGFRAAVRQDARRCSALRGETHQFDSKAGEWSSALHLMWASDDFLGVVLYRLRVSLYDRGVPLVPRLLHLFCRAAFRINIGNQVVVGEGLYVLHGNVTIEGQTRIGANVSIAPWVSIGDDDHAPGPTISNAVFIGTGSTIRGPIVVGDRATVGACSIVATDVPSDATFVGQRAIEHALTPTPPTQDSAASSDELRRVRAAAERNDNEQPPLGRALRADGVAFASNDRRPFPSRASEWRNVVRLLVRSPAFVAVAMYRLRSTLRARRIPVLASLTNKLTIALFNLRIGDTVLVAPGVCIPEGDVVIDGITAIDAGCTIGPSTTIGLQPGAFLGPHIESAVRIGADAVILGDILVGRGAQIRPTSLVVRDVEANAIVHGVPARTVDANVGEREESNQWRDRGKPAD